MLKITLGGAVVALVWNSCTGKELNNNAIANSELYDDMHPPETWNKEPFEQSELYRDMHPPSGWNEKHENEGVIAKIQRFMEDSDFLRELYGAEDTKNQEKRALRG